MMLLIDYTDHYWRGNRIMKDFLKIVFGWVFFHLYWLRPLEDKVSFASFNGEKYSDNPKYISEEFHKAYPDIKLVWFYKKNRFANAPNYVQQVKWGTLDMIKEMATSKIWVDSFMKPVWVFKRKGQFYLQTWHGGLGFKKIEADVADKLPKESIRRLKHNSKMIDMVISNSDWTTKIFGSAFLCDGKVLKTGLPKSSALLSNQTISKKRVRSFYHIKDNTQIALYAPTLRENPREGQFNLDIEEIKKALTKKFGKEWEIIVKLHPYNEEFQDKLHMNDDVLDGRKYTDMQELISAADFYISDYSGSIFDAALLRKRIICYIPDEKDYEKERGLYVSIRDLPFPVANTNHDLYNEIIDFDDNSYRKKLSEYYKMVGLYESKEATSNIVNILVRKLRNES